MVFQTTTNLGNIDNMTVMTTKQEHHLNTVQEEAESKGISFKRAIVLKSLRFSLQQ